MNCFFIDYENKDFIFNMRLYFRYTIYLIQIGHSVIGEIEFIVL